MDENAPKPGGWLHLLRRAVDTLLGLAQNRFELFTVELQEEKLRALNVILWLVIALAFIVAGLLIGLGALAIYLWGIAGYPGLIGLAVVALAAGAGVLWGIRRGIRDGPTPFAETIGEFRKDRECLRNDH